MKLFFLVVNIVDNFKSDVLCNSFFEVKFYVIGF